MCNGGKNAIGVTGFFLAGFKAHLRRKRVPGTENIAMNSGLGSSEALELFRALFYFMDTVSNFPLNL